MAAEAAEAAGQLRCGPHVADTLLARGVYGDVYRGRHTASGKTIAMKIVERSEDLVTWWKALASHEHVVKLHDWCRKSGESILAVMDYCELHDLSTYLEGLQSSPDASTQLSLMQQAALGLQHLHDNLIAHRDVNPDHILLTRRGGRLVVKLGVCCGLSIKLSSVKERRNTICGSIGYIASDIYQLSLRGGTAAYSPLCADVFSLGVLFWAVLLHAAPGPLHHPCVAENCIGVEIMQCVENKQPLPVLAPAAAADSSSRAAIKTLIRRMLDHRPDSRISIAGVVLKLQEMQIDTGHTIQMAPRVGLSIYAPSHPGTKCKFAKLCCEFITNMKLTADLFEPSRDCCFCESRHRQRGDKDLYQRGEPPSKYAIPVGWCRFGLRLPPHAGGANKALEKWHRVYHGTLVDSVQGILQTGQLATPDSETVTQEVKERSGHYNDKNKPNGFDTKNVFFSPSPIYAETYAKQSIIRLSSKDGRSHKARVAFQILLHPDSYQIREETKGYKGRKEICDPRFSNMELEYYTKKLGSHFFSGLLVKID